MKLTQRNYEEIGAVVRAARIPGGASDETERAIERTLDGLVENLAALFATENPRFNRDRFIAGCRR